MKVTITASIAGQNFSFHAGQVVELPDATAQSWITHNIARPAPDDAEPHATIDPVADATAPVQTPDPASPKAPKAPNAPKAK